MEGSRQVRYIGPHRPGVTVERPDGSSVTADFDGEPITTTAEHADALLRQTSNWEAVKASKSAAQKKED